MREPGTELESWYCQSGERESRDVSFRQVLLVI